MFGKGCQTYAGRGHMAAAWTMAAIVLSTWTAVATVISVWRVSGRSPPQLQLLTRQCKKQVMCDSCAACVNVLWHVRMYYVSKYVHYEAGVRRSGGQRVKTMYVLQAVECLL